MAGKRILMGVIGRPHGVRGLVHVHSHTEHDLAAYSPLLDEAGRAWTLAWRADGIAELRDAQGRPLPDRTAAERLVNVKLYLERDRLREPDLEEFYLADLLGLSAVSAEGAPLGRVVQVHDYGAGVSLELDGGALIPFTHACVPDIDLQGGTLTVVPPQVIELPLPPGEGGGEGLATLTQPSPASGRGLDERAR